MNKENCALLSLHQRPMIFASIRRSIPRLALNVRCGAHLVLLAWLTGCMVWTPRPLGSPLADNDQLKGWVRVNLSTGPSLQMKDVQITADSVTGLRDDSAIERV